MATAALREVDEQADYGRLANNYMIVQAVQNALSRSEMNIHAVPGQIGRLIEEDAWREFYDTNRSVHVKNPADFRRFIESPRPEGCQTPIHVLRHMVKGTDVADAVEELLRGTPGAPEGAMRNPDGANQWINRNPITVNPPDDPAIIPMPSPNEKPARKRDYSRESKQGTSVGYVLRRLEKQAPEYLERVKAGELSPNGAAVAAGLFDKKITVPAVPSKAARVLVRHFRGDDLAELIDLLTDAMADGSD